MAMPAAPAAPAASGSSMSMMKMLLGLVVVAGAGFLIWWLFIRKTDEGTTTPKPTLAPTTGPTKAATKEPSSSDAMVIGIIVAVAVVVIGVAVWYFYNARKTGSTDDDKNEVFDAAERRGSASSFDAEP